MKLILMMIFFGSTLPNIHIQYDSHWRGIPNPEYVEDKDDDVGDRKDDSSASAPLLRVNS